MNPAPSAEGRGNSMLSCYEFDVGISNTDLMRETDVRLGDSLPTLEELAGGLDHCQTGDRHQMEQAWLQALLAMEVEGVSRPSEDRQGDSRVDRKHVSRKHVSRKPSLGNAADPIGTSPSRFRHCGIDYSPRSFLTAKVDSIIRYAISYSETCQFYNIGEAQGDES